MRLSDIIDNLLTFLSGSFMGTVIIGYFTRGTVAAVGGVAVGVCITGLTALLRLRRGLPAENRKKTEEITEALVFMGPDNARDYIAAALSKRYDVRACDDYLICGKSAVFCFIRPRALTVSDVAEFYGAARGKHKSIVVLCCGGADSAAASAAEKYGVKIMGKDKLVALLTLTGCVPAPPKTVKSKKPRKLIAALGSALDRPKAKKYFLASLLLFGGAMLLPMSVYYTAAACLSLALGIACMIPKKAK